MQPGLAEKNLILRIYDLDGRRAMELPIDKNGILPEYTASFWSLRPRSRKC